MSTKSFASFDSALPKPSLPGSNKDLGIAQPVMSLVKALNSVPEGVKAEYELYSKEADVAIVQDGCRIFEEKFLKAQQDLDTLKNTLPFGYASKEELKGLKLGKKELKEQKSQNKKIEERWRKEIAAQQRVCDALLALKDTLFSHSNGLA